jgi:NADH-quinone oxidoreductase subunit N
MTVTPVDIGAILPEIILVVYGCAVLLLETFTARTQKDILAYWSLAGLALAGYGTARLMWAHESVMGGLFLLDPYSNFFKLVLYVAAAVTILLSMNYLKQENINVGEYYAIILFATSGMMVMVSGADLLVIFLGLELTALSFYVLAGFKRFEVKSIEAAAKYFVLGSFSSGILLFGISLLFGLAGTTRLEILSGRLQAMAASGDLDPAWILAMIFLVVGFGFKVAVIPFHMWTPDVYEGAPTPITAFLSAASKAASFAVFLRVFQGALGGMHESWQLLLILLSVLTIFLGNIVAIAQSNIKRMLAYSSIAHAGYAMIGLAVGSRVGAFSVMLYMLAYALMNFGAFGVVILLRKGGVEGDEISDFAGLAKRHRLAALIMLIFMFSLAGIPPTAGFIGKFYIFMAAVQADLAWLAVLGVIGSAISAYFYLRVVMVMYMKEPDGEVTLFTPRAAVFALTVVAVAVVILGVFPGPVVNFTDQAVLKLSQSITLAAP